MIILEDAGAGKKYNTENGTYFDIFLMTSMSSIADGCHTVQKRVDMDFEICGYEGGMGGKNRMCIDH